MKLIIITFGILAILAGISLLINPDFIINWLENNIESKSLYFSAFAVRLILGVSFILAAKESKYPMAIKIIGYLFVIAAVIFIFMGQARFQDFLGSLIPGFTPYATLSGIISIAFGCFLIYAFSRKND